MVEIQSLNSGPTKFIYTGLFNEHIFDTELIVGQKTLHVPQICDCKRL